MTIWQNPIPAFTLLATSDSMSFQGMPANTTGLPLAPLHPGSYGFKRRYHVHEGVDLYCPPGTAVHVVEDCEIVAIENFTGPNALTPTPWWKDTQAVLARGPTGTIVYGELTAAAHLSPGKKLPAGALIGHVIPVLIEDKGRPMTMLHLELHTPGITRTFEWAVNDVKPLSLQDPTPYLMPLTIAPSP